MSITARTNQNRALASGSTVTTTFIFSKLKTTRMPTTVASYECITVDLDRVCSTKFSLLYWKTDDFQFRHPFTVSIQYVVLRTTRNTLVVVALNSDPCLFNYRTIYYFTETTYINQLTFAATNQPTILNRLSHFAFLIQWIDKPNRIVISIYLSIYQSTTTTTVTAESNHQIINQSIDKSRKRQDGVSDKR